MLILELTKKLIGSSKHVSEGLFILEFHKIMNGWITFVGEFLILALSHLYSGTDLGSTKDGKEKPVPGTALALPRLLLLEETIC